MQFTLMDGRLLMAMEKFDGVFDGQDVISLLLVHIIDDGGERGGFA